MSKQLELSALKKKTEEKITNVLKAIFDPEIPVDIYELGLIYEIKIDDSIVRGTTLKQSVIRILDRLEPKKIVIASSAPQIRYPDCYGIDMAKLGDFIAFQAAINLLNESEGNTTIDDVYHQCKTAEKNNTLKEENFVKRIYESFSNEDISAKISSLLTHSEINTEVEIIFQTVENLHIACPDHKGDWYFTGDYPTVGGNKVVNKAFMYFVEGNNKRAY